MNIWTKITDGYHGETRHRWGSKPWQCPAHSSAAEQRQSMPASWSPRPNQTEPLTPGNDNHQITIIHVSYFVTSPAIIGTTQQYCHVETENNKLYRPPLYAPAPCKWWLCGGRQAAARSGQWHINCWHRGKLSGDLNSQPKWPGNLDFWRFDFESGVRVMCDVGYLCANFSLPRPLFST